CLLNPFNHMTHAAQNHLSREEHRSADDHSTSTHRLVQWGHEVEHLYRLGVFAAIRFFCAGGVLGFGLPLLSATAPAIRSFNAGSLMRSPSWISMARVDLASRPALKRPCGSFSEAPLKKLTLT